LRHLHACTAFDVRKHSAQLSGPLYRLWKKRQVYSIHFSYVPVAAGCARVGGQRGSWHAVSMRLRLSLSEPRPILESYSYQLLENFADYLVTLMQRISDSSRTRFTAGSLITNKFPLRKRNTAEGGFIRLHRAGMSFLM
jgi:hypothetical protein